MRNGIVGVAAALLFASLALAAEGDAVVAAMIDEGAPPAVAACLVDKLGDDAARLFTADDSDLSEDDMQKLVAALTDCSDVDAGE